MPILAGTRPAPAAAPAPGKRASLTRRGKGHLARLLREVKPPRQARNPRQPKPPKERRKVKETVARARKRLSRRRPAPAPRTAPVMTRPAPARPAPAVRAPGAPRTPSPRVRAHGRHRTSRVPSGRPAGRSGR